MNKNTKQQAIIDFMNDLKYVYKKVKINSADIQDYVLLREYLLMLGLSEKQIEDIYIGCGFKDAKDFYTQRQKPFNFQTGNVSCTLSKIQGTTEAVLEFLQNQVDRMDNT